MKAHATLLLILASPTALAEDRIDDCRPETKVAILNHLLAQPVCNHISPQTKELRARYLRRLAADHPACYKVVAADITQDDDEVSALAADAIQKLGRSSVKERQYHIDLCADPKKLDKLGTGTIGQGANNSFMPNPLRGSA